MIFYCDLQGNLKAFQNETVYQGSNNVTTIYVVAPFNRPVGLNISFTKPNKLVTSPAIMKWVGTLGNVKIPVSFVNIPEQFTDTYNVWAYALPYSITEQNGVVGVSVNAVIADSVDASGQQAYKGNLTTFTGQFTVAYSALPSPPTDIPTEWTQDKVLDLLNNYYNDAIQKIGEMNTLKTDAKDTLVKAINEVFDEIASTNATIGDLSTLTTDEKTTIVGAINEVDAHADANKAEIGDLNTLTTDEKATLVGAINEVDNHADNATTLANNAVATANGAVATANEAKTTAQTAENNANSAVDKADSAIDRANKAYEKAANNVYAVGFMTLQEAITAVNGYDNTVLKTNDNILVVAQGSPDLYVTSVEATNIPYNFTTVDKFNDDLVKNTVLQIGYYKVAFYETDGQPVTVAYQNVVVKSTDWVASTEFADFPYEAKITLSNFVDYKTVPQVVFDIADTMSGNYAPICKSGDKCVYIYGKVQNEITLKTVITFAPNVNGASVTGGGYNNRGKWVASTTYAIDDLVYTDNGQFVCIEGITSTTSPEQDTTHWQATFVATGKTKNGLKFSGQDNGTGVQKTFDGSTAVEIAFDENTMTAKEVNGVLKVGAKGTIPEALPQEASALKSGNLPTSGWADIAGFFFDGNAHLSTSYQKITTLSENDLTLIVNNWGANKLKVSEDGTRTYTYSLNSHNEGTDSYYLVFGTSYKIGMLIDKVTRDVTVAQISSTSYDLAVVQFYNTQKTVKTYTISDTSITANSDILMELTDEGGVKSYSMEAGSITVIRDTVPTQPIPYTYKVKQTNASGQFTLVNHFVPSIPESPTSLPVTYKKASGELPTSGWTDANGFFFDGGMTLTKTYQKMMTLSLEDYNLIINNWNTTYIKITQNETEHYTFGIYSRQEENDVYNLGFGQSAVYVRMKINKTTREVFVAKTDTSYTRVINKFYNTLNTVKTYSISDTSITANTSVKMYLTDEGGVKAYSKASGSITVIRDSVPTSAIPYEYEVEETSAEGLFEVINAYVPAVPTKTSQLTNDSGFITAADIPSAGEWVTVTENSATLTEAGTYQVLFGENYGVQSIIYWDGSTGANGIPSTTASVTNGTAIIAERYLTVAENGVLSTHITMITVKDGSWTQTTPSFSGFKYRKIN